MFSDLLPQLKRILKKLKTIHVLQIMKAVVLFWAIISIIVFLARNQPNETIGLLFIMFFFLLISEAFERNWKFDFNAKEGKFVAEPQEIKQKEVVKENITKRLEESLTLPKPQLQNVTELVQKDIDTVFEMGFNLGKDYQGRYRGNIFDVMLLKDANGKITGIQYNEN